MPLLRDDTLKAHGITSTNNALVVKSDILSLSPQRARSEAPPVSLPSPKSAPLTGSSISPRSLLGAASSPSSSPRLASSGSPRVSAGPVPPKPPLAPPPFSSLQATTTYTSGTGTLKQDPPTQTASTVGKSVATTPVSTSGTYLNPEATSNLLLYLFLPRQTQKEDICSSVERSTKVGSNDGSYSWMTSCTTSKPPIIPRL